MKKIIAISWMLLIGGYAFGQATIVPAQPQSKTIAIFGAIIHTGTGQVINNGTLVFAGGKIISVSEGKNIPQGDVTAIDATGKHVYPGFIACLTNLGLAEFAMVKSTVDFQELGTFNPHVRAIIAYNAESKVIPVVRSNGILLAQVSPVGGIIAGQSAIVQLDAWNWEDAAVKADEGVQFEWPSAALRGGETTDQARQRQEKIYNDLIDLIKEAKAYAEMGRPEDFNARLDAMKGLFNGTKKAYVRADLKGDILEAIQFFRKFGITPVIVGGEESYLVSDLLKEHNVPVILHYPHSYPSSIDDDVYGPSKLAAQLQKDGVLFAISLEFVRNWGYLQLRNLPFEAGLAAAYGLTKEQALASITLNAAKILGVDKAMGSLEPGKDATLFISGGDALDMMTNNVQRAFIQGRDISLDNLHKQLHKRYGDKYGLSEK